jgi:hypothetical protein
MQTAASEIKQGFARRTLTLTLLGSGEVVGKQKGARWWSSTGGLAPKGPIGTVVREQGRGGLY